MKLAVDLYHPKTGDHKRIVMEADSGDEAADTASRMHPGYNVRSIVPYQDRGAPELRLPAATAARYEGHAPDEAARQVQEELVPVKRGRGRPRKHPVTA